MDEGKGGKRVRKGRFYEQEGNEWSAQRARPPRGRETGWDE